MAAPFVDAFPCVSEDVWRAKVEAALKGAPLKKLAGKTYDGFEIQPLYPRVSGKPRAFRAAGDWRIVARLDHPDPAAGQRTRAGRSRKRRQWPADRFRRRDRAPAASAFRRRGSWRGARGRPSRRGPENPARPSRRFEAPSRLCSTVVAERGYDAQKLDISFGLDPIGGGGARRSARLAQGRIEAGGTGKKSAARGFARSLSAPRALIHAAGGSPAQELAFALGSGLPIAGAGSWRGRSNGRGKRSISASPPTPTNF